MKQGARRIHGDKKLTLRNKDELASPRGVTTTLRRCALRWVKLVQSFYNSPRIVRLVSERQNEYNAKPRKPKQGSTANSRRIRALFSALGIALVGLIPVTDWVQSITVPIALQNRGSR